MAKQDDMGLALDVTSDLILSRLERGIQYGELLSDAFLNPTVIFTAIR